MATSYTWIITPPLVKTEGSFVDVVKSVGWSLVASDGTNEASRSGVAYFGTPTDAATFTSFNSVTQATVIGWVLDDLGKTEAQLKKELDRELAAQSSTIKVPTGW